MESPSPFGIDDLRSRVIDRVRKILEDEQDHPTRAALDAFLLLRQYRVELLTWRHIRAHGTAVQSGPFAGMRFAAQVAGSGILPKLIGSYEAELHPIIDAVAKSAYTRIVNIGCGEGD